MIKTYTKLTVRSPFQHFTNAMFQCGAALVVKRHIICQLLVCNTCIVCMLHIYCMNINIYLSRKKSVRCHYQMYHICILYEPWTCARTLTTEKKMSTACEWMSNCCCLVHTLCASVYLLYIDVCMRVHVCKSPSKHCHTPGTTIQTHTGNSDTPSVKCWIANQPNWKRHRGIRQTNKRLKTKSKRIKSDTNA